MSGQLKEVRERIKSVNSTQQITNAMKMVSAAKLRKAQMAITDMRPYADRLNHILKNILSNLDGGGSTSFGVEREVNNLAVVIITSDKGLCGAFNTNIIKAAINSIEAEHAEVLEKGGITIFPIGKKAYDGLKRRYDDKMFDKQFSASYSDTSTEGLSEVSQFFMDKFEAGEFDKVIVCYSSFKNAAVQFPQAVQYLPVEKVEVEAEISNQRADYIFEPGEEELLKELIPTILHTTYQKFLLDTHASEHGARMTAMDNATENAEELKKELKISYNKARQEAITKELAEIVGGAAALGG
jgi:F-type H+-transporting ATPase subunit gamma